MSTTAPARGRRLRIPRRIRPGARRASGPDALLTCAVLARTEDEWVGVDLSSGALVRSPAAQGGAFPPSAPFEVVAFAPRSEEGPPDPARPEAVLPAGQPRTIGRLRPRRARKLLARLAAPERDGAPLLGTWGPSVAFVDLEGSTPSVVLIAARRRALSIGPGRDGLPEVVLSWASLPQHLPLADPVAAELTMPRHGALEGQRLVAALGFRPGYVLVGLGAIERGHARKAVLALLPG